MINVVPADRTVEELVDRALYLGGCIKDGDDSQTVLEVSPAEWCRLQQLSLDDFRIYRLHNSREFELCGIPVKEMKWYFQL